MGDDERDDLDRDAILARRRRFIAAALTGLVMTHCSSTVEGVDAATDVASDAAGDVTTDRGPQPCLTPLPPDAGPDAGTAQPCLGALPDDAGPQPCLSADAGPPVDVGFDAGPQPCLDVAFDAGPMPCLEPPPPDASEPVDASEPLDAEPTPCLRIAPDSGGVDR